MYEFHRALIDLAEKAAGIDRDDSPDRGDIDSITMCKFGDDTYHHSIDGRTADGRPFKLSLEVSKCQKSE